MATKKKPLGPIRRLCCTRCGEPTRGRQWFNLDTGHGLCAPCGDWFEANPTPGETVEELAGKRGVHWDIKEAKA